MESSESEANIGTKEELRLLQDNGKMAFVYLRRPTVLSEKLIYYNS